MTEPKYILAIDDDPKIRKLLKDMLEIEGFEAATAEDGMSGLIMINERTPDLVLLDLMMPTLDGFETAQRIRKVSDVPIVAISAIQDVKTIEHSSGHGIDDYLTKPFTKQALISIVRSKLRYGDKEP